MIMVALTTPPAPTPFNNKNALAHASNNTLLPANGICNCRRKEANGQQGNKAGWGLRSPLGSSRRPAAGILERDPLVKRSRSIQKKVPKMALLYGFTWFQNLYKKK